MGFRVSKQTHMFWFSNSEAFNQEDIGGWKGNMAYRKNRAIGREEVLDSDRVVLIFHNNTDSRCVNRDMLFDLPALQLSHS